MKGALGGKGVVNSTAISSSFYRRCPCCFDKRVKGGKRGMKYRAMKVRNEEPSPLSLLALLLSGFSFQGVPLHFDWIYPYPSTIRVQSPNILGKQLVSSPVSYRRH